MRRGGPRLGRSREVARGDRCGPDRRVDDQILALLDRRAEVVRESGDIKRERRETFHVPQRERAVLERLTAAANGAFPREAVRPVFREIMSACLSLESPLVVSYPGPEATFSHLAGKTRFGLSARYVPPRAWARCSARWGGAPTTASCPSRRRRRAWSRTRSTTSSIRIC